MSPQKSKQDFSACSLVGEKNKDESFPVVEAEKSTLTMRNLQKNSLLMPLFLKDVWHNSVILISERARHLFEKEEILLYRFCNLWRQGNQKANPMKLRAIYQNSWLQINSLTLNNLFHLLTQTLLKLLSVLSYLLQCPTVCEALLDSPLRLQIAVFLHMLLFSS